MKKPEPVRRPISVEVAGKVHNGVYWRSAGRVVEVSYNGRTKGTQIGGSPIESIAKMLLSEMVRGLP
jgi:hypothetical protein